MLSWLILKERLTHDKLLAVALSILGTFLIVGVARGEPLFSTRTQVGDWLAIASGLAYSTWYIFGKILGRDRDPAVTSLLALCFGTIFLFPLMILTEGIRIPNGLLAWELVAAMGTIPTVMAYLLYLGGLRLVDATKASVFAIIEPLSAAILAFFFLQETLSYDSLLGFALIISSIILISKNRTQPQPVLEPLRAHQNRYFGNAYGYVDYRNFELLSMFKLIILLKKKQNLSDEEFAKYWLETHAPLAKKMPGLRKYVVNVVRRPPNREPEYNGVVELWFDDIDSMKKTFASAEGQATQKDTEKFASSPTTLYIDEHTIT
jgi:uncharacterized protein (TIGR02118 family)